MVVNDFINPANPISPLNPANQSWLYDTSSPAPESSPTVDQAFQSLDIQALQDQMLSIFSHVLWFLPILLLPIILLHVIRRMKMVLGYDDYPTFSSVSSSSEVVYEPRRVSKYPKPKQSLRTGKYKVSRRVVTLDYVEEE